MYDVLIIGGGVIGCAIARELTKYKLDVVLLEKEEDVSCGASKANSGIVHAGYDAEPNTKKALFNVLGSHMYPDLARELGVPYKNIGSLVLGDRNGLEKLKELLARGIKNGVKGLEILDRKKLLEIEPNIADEVEYGLYAPTAAVVSPYQMTVALAEQAAVNGAKFELDCYISKIEKNKTGYTVFTNKGQFDAKVLINAAGYGADKISEMCNGPKIDYVFTRGDYFVLDTVERKKYNHTCFPLPNEKGKGCLVSPSADGNVIVGPTAINVKLGDDTATQAEGLNYVKQDTARIIKNVNFRNVIRVFSGVRAVAGNDFIIRQDDNLITVAGICSPGLSSAPAIAKHVAEELVTKAGLKLVKKENFIPRYIPPVTREMSKKEWEKLIAVNPAYSKIVCRCEKVTEGEIIDALNSPLKPKSLDAVKRRARAGMGRCQGGFCTSRVMEIINRECGVPFTEITKKGKGSEIVVCEIKEETK